MGMESNEAKIPMYVLTQDQINQIAAVAAKEAVSTFKTEQVKADKNRSNENVRQTKKMLSSYRRIKAKMSEESEFTEEEITELRWKCLQDLMGNANEIVSKSERMMKDEEKRRQEDLYCIYQIEKATDLYKQECEKYGNEEAKRRYRELEMMYLDENVYSVKEISEVENVSEKTVYKDLGIACGIVAIYLHGMYF